MSGDQEWPSLHEVAYFATSSSSDEQRSLQERLQELSKVDPDRVVGIFDELASHPSPAAREYAAVIGSEICGGALAPILERLFDDLVLTVQESALEALMTVAPEVFRARTPVVLSKFSRWRRNEDMLNYLTWMVARMGLKAAVPELRSIEADPTRTPKVRWDANLLAAYLDQGPEAILRRIRAHDHEYMRVLCAAAFRLGIEGAMAAYRHCATTAPDEKCRGLGIRFAECLARAEKEGADLWTARCT